MAKEESNPKEQFFRLHHTGHLPNRIKPNEEQVRSTMKDVKEFCTVFYSKCNQTGSDLVTSRHFYSKVGFIFSDKSPHGYDILIDLICDTGLLFAQDFGMDVDTDNDDDIDNDSQGMSIDAFSLNRKYFQSRPDKEKSTLRSAQNEIVKLYFGDSDKEFLSRRFNDFIDESLEGMTPEKMKSMQIPASYLDGLDNEDIEWLQSVLIPKFIQRWESFLWMKDCNKRYHRAISIWHREKFDRIKIRKERMQKAYDKAVEWLSLEPQNLIYFKSLSYHSLKKVIDNMGLQRLQIDDSKVERFINKVISEALLNNKSDLITLCDLILSESKISTSKKTNALVTKMLLMVNLLDCSDMKNKIATARYAWRHWGLDINFPSRPFFQEVKKSDTELLVKYFPPIQFGLIVNDLLTETFVDRPECLTHFNPYLSHVDMVNRFKKLYSETYQDFVKKVSKSQMLNGYQVKWCDPKQQKDDILEYLECHLRYAPLFIPEDEQLWSVVPHYQKYIKKLPGQLKIMLLENALQDCLRDKASQKLWDMLVEIIV